MHFPRTRSCTCQNDHNPTMIYGHHYTKTPAPGWDWPSQALNVDGDIQWGVISDIMIDKQLVPVTMSRVWRPGNTYKALFRLRLYFKDLGIPLYCPPPGDERMNCGRRTFADLAWHQVTPPNERWYVFPLIKANRLWSAHLFMGRHLSGRRGYWFLEYHVISSQTQPLWSGLEAQRVPLGHRILQATTFQQENRTLLLITIFEPNAGVNCLCDVRVRAG